MRRITPRGICSTSRGMRSAINTRDVERDHKLRGQIGTAQRRVYFTRNINFYSAAIFRTWGSPPPKDERARSDWTRVEIARCVQKKYAICRLYRVARIAFPACLFFTVTLRRCISKARLPARFGSATERNIRDDIFRAVSTRSYPRVHHEFV